MADQYLCVFENKLTNPIIVKAVAAEHQWTAAIPAGGTAKADPADDEGLAPGERMLLIWDGLSPTHMITFLKVKIDKSLNFKIKANVIEVSPL